MPDEKCYAEEKRVFLVIDIAGTPGNVDRFIRNVRDDVIAMILLSGHKSPRVSMYESQVAPGGVA